MDHRTHDELDGLRPERLRPYAGGVDIHCHCLPGLDDGPATTAKALELCRALVEDGIDTVVATPHQLGRYDGRNSGAVVREAVDALQAALVEQDVPLAVLTGAEVRMDERIPRLIRDGELLTLADQPYLLLELSPDAYTDPLPLIRWLAREGVKVIVAHPERYQSVVRRLEAARPWVEDGAALQINAGSILGDFGPEAQRAAWGLLQQPWPVLVATDAHDTKSRPPRLSQAMKHIERRLGSETARRACVEGPRSVLPVAPLAGCRT